MAKKEILPGSTEWRKRWAEDQAKKRKEEKRKEQRPPGKRRKETRTGVDAQVDRLIKRKQSRKKNPHK
jgi:hypothetical protein